MFDADSNKFETKQVFSLFRCGRSPNIPFCDRTHRRTFQSCVARIDGDKEQ
ncbi:CDGSH iron-sulfur domain-containing protein [Cytobacillus sp. NCCP-133]|uniref:CDGSH iron-sulfur domain-containing protein n=1 Tax=Cytobacillus sp. NCCP-133 TaxID=766848 RepID=UPI0022324650|nr:CDGSH iron-sulfur domain-containing protein [Cytobacillus sp. NCCP-133]